MDCRSLLLGCALLALVPAASAQLARPAPVAKPMPVAPLAVRALPPGAEARERRWLAQAPALRREWVVAEAVRQRTVADPDPAVIAAAARTRFPGVGSGDIEALVFLVMMAMQRDADEDLRRVAEQQETLRERRREERGASANKPADAQAPGVEPRLGEITSLRLQAHQERRRKIHEAISAMMAKFSQTQDSITDNIK